MGLPFSEPSWSLDAPLPAPSSSPEPLDSALSSSLDSPDSAYDVLAIFVREDGDAIVYVPQVVVIAFAAALYVL
jgi:hypothetical protein